MLLAVPQVPAQQSVPEDALLDVQSTAAPRTAEEVQSELRSVQSSISVSRENAARIRAEIAGMQGDRSRQSAALIAAAQQVKLAEIEVSAIEDRLTGLLAEENAIRDRLNGADRNVSTLLASLQRISRTPPPALLVDPGDALGSARSALLLTAVLPQLRARAGGVADDLSALVTVRQSVETEKDKLRANLSTLVEERLRTAVLIEARRQGTERLGTALALEEEQARQLAAEAETLGDLADTLQQGGTLPLPQSGLTGPLDRQTILAALAETGRKAPAIPFSSARGFLSLPASGVMVGEYGRNDGFGGTSKGVSIVTRAGAQVVAPADGYVTYKGPYLNYGQIVILNTGGGYSILLAGLEATSVEFGQFVMMGEPLGTMGSRTIGRGVTTSAGVSRPTLYIEMRNQNTPFDPARWWADTEQMTRSG